MGRKDSDKSINKKFVGQIIFVTNSYSSSMVQQSF